MKGDEGYFNDHTYKSRWRVEQLKNALETQKLKLEEAHISKKTYEGMLERMRVRIEFELSVIPCRKIIWLIK